MKKKIILTGDSPTYNKLHIGHYFGSIKKRIKYQKKNKLYLIIADNQAISNKKNIDKINKNIIEITIEYLALGINTKYTNIFVQSQIPELNEFYTFFLNFVNYNFLIKNPTIRKELKNKKIDNLGFITYPISQAADILSFLSDYTIVGKDQIPIIEQVNRISKKVNNFLGNNFFKKCKIINGNNNTIMGIYGKNKMSKSLNNSININSTDKEICKVVNKIYTDPNRIKKNIPGNYKNNMVFKYLSLFNYNTNKLKKEYLNGNISDCYIKKILKEQILDFLIPVKKKIDKYKKNIDFIIEVLKKGTKISRDIVCKNLEKFKKNFGKSIF
ncbi:tryptophan--tRNA ligase [Candidatus Vidania fulgoroideae]|nr:tryptophan--tRNA ligase [Candidatus Vidania fulgoroideae]WDR79306.1 tryptophan--tRNA ligase [Candidatus Vidania fulgoroideae]